MADNHSAFQEEPILAQPQKASVAIYEQIRSKILSGELKPGDKLPPEREMIDLFQRSRPTIREAMRMLENKNYISTSRKGAFVNKPTTDQAAQTLNSLMRLRLVSEEDLLSVRHICETLVIKTACETRTEKDITKMQTILNESYEVRSDFSRFMEYGIRFNGAMAKASHNEMLYLVTRIVSQFSHDKMTITAATLTEAKKQEITQKITAQHQAILDAIIMRNAPEAVRLNDIHLNLVGQDLY